MREQGTAATQALSKSLGRSPTRNFPTQRATETPQGAAHWSHTPNGAGSTSAFRVLHAFLYLPSLRSNLQPQRASAALAAHPGHGPRQHTRRQLAATLPPSDGRSRSSRPSVPSRGRTAGGTAWRSTVPRGPPRHRLPQGPAAFERRSASARPPAYRASTPAARLLPPVTPEPPRP